MKTLKKLNSSLPNTTLLVFNAIRDWFDPAKEGTPYAEIEEPNIFSEKENTGWARRIRMAIQS